MLGKKEDADKSTTLNTVLKPVGFSGSGGQKVEAFLGHGSKVVGSLTFTGPVEVDGYIEGELSAQDRLTIGESAVINARISGSEIVVKGTVNGDISASKLLTLQRPAKVTGNITSSNLSIEEGVVFEGKCSMSGTSSLSQNKPSMPKPASPDKIASI